MRGVFSADSRRHSRYRIVMRFWRLVVADRSSGGVIAVLVGLLLAVQTIVGAVAATSGLDTGQFAGLATCLSQNDDVPAEPGRAVCHDCILCQVAGPCPLPLGASLPLPQNRPAARIAPAWQAVLVAHRHHFLPQTRGPPFSI